MSQIENIKGPGALCIFSFMGRMIATEPRDPVFNHEKVCFTPTGTKSVLIPLLPILWVRHLSDGTAVATFALVPLLYHSTGGCS